MIPRSAALGLLAVLVSRAGAGQDPGIRLTTLEPGLHVISGFANGNMLVIEGGTELILVDAQSGPRVAAADSALRRVTRKPVRQVVFTHYHEDHVGGMPHWRRTGAAAIAHVTVPAQMAKDTVIAEVDGWHRTPAPAAALPDLTFPARLHLDLDGRRIQVIHLPSAHTDGDAVVWLPWANLLHVGDLVEPGAAPFIDWWAGGTLDGMIAAADRLLGLTNAGTRIVPGHGPVVDRRTIEQHRRMLGTLRDRVGAGIRSGLSPDQIVAGRPLVEFEELLGGPSRAERLIRLTYHGLTRR